MNTPLNELQMWIALLALFLSTGTAIWNLLTTGHKKHARDIADLRADVSKYAKKIERLEQKVEDLPNKEALHRLELSMAKMAGDTREMRAGMKPVLEMASAFMIARAGAVKVPKKGD